MKKPAQDRVTRTTKYEAYFDLYGYTWPWINAICDALHEYTKTSLGDEGESYKCEACMSFRFTSTDRKRRDGAEAVFARLEPLARRTLHKGDGETFYLQR